MPPTDIVDLLSEEHGVLRGLASVTRDRSGRTRGTSLEDPRVVYLELSDRIIRHEIAEELVISPALLDLDDGESMTHYLGIDELGIEELLEFLDRQEFGSWEFNYGEAELLAELLAHLAREEAEVHPILITRFTGERRAELARRFRRVTRSVPLLSADLRARLPMGPTVVSRTSALAVWMRDVAHSAGLVE